MGTSRVRAVTQAPLRPLAHRCHLWLTRIPTDLDDERAAADRLWVHWPHAHTAVAGAPGVAEDCPIADARQGSLDPVNDLGQRGIA